MDKRYVCEEIAEIYGVKVTTVWSWIRNGKLKVFKLGKRYYVKQEDLEKFEIESVKKKD